MSLEPGAVLGRPPTKETLPLDPGQAGPVEGSRSSNDIHIEHGTPGQVLDLHGDLFHRHRVDAVRAQEPCITGPVIEGKLEDRPAAQGCNLRRIISMMRRPLPGRLSSFGEPGIFRETWRSLPIPGEHAPGGRPFPPDRREAAPGLS